MRHPYYWSGFVLNGNTNSLTPIKNDKSIHLQKVNNTHKQIRDFLKPFNGVSSKYLQNYLHWFAYMDKIRNSKTMLKQWFVTMLLTDQAYALYELFKDNAVIIRT